MERHFLGQPDQDLLVGSPYRTVSSLTYAGGVSQYLGSSSGVGSTYTNWNRANDTSGATTAGGSDYFGLATTAGDFNDDGFDDVAIGAAGDANFAGGSVDIYLGSASGLVATPQTLRPPGPNAGDFFGGSVVAGDFNCDGYDDLAVAATSKTVASVVGAGEVFVFLGSASGLATTPATFLTFDGSGETPIAYDFFGFRLAAGNFNYDRHNGIECVDLAIGVPFRDIGAAADAGAVYVNYGAVTLTNTLTKFTKSSISGTPATGDNFGYDVSAFRLATNQYDHLVVAEPGANSAAGAIHVLEGTTAGLQVGKDAGGTPITWTQDTLSPGTSVAGDRWGHAVSAAGPKVLLVGAPYKDNGGATDTGSLSTILLSDSTQFAVASSNRYWQSAFTTAPPPLNGNASNLHFGVALSRTRSGR